MSPMLAHLVVNFEAMGLSDELGHLLRGATLIAH